jgi:Ca2+-binding EF-hand superfamily protein
MLGRRRSTTKRSERLTDDELAFLVGVPSSQIAEFREIFRLVDINNNGTIDASELKHLMKSLHFDELLLNDNYFSELITRVTGISKHADADEFSFDDFIVSICHRPDVSYTKNDVRNAFAVLAGKSELPGSISYKKLSEALSGSAARAAAENHTFSADEILLMTSNSPNGIVNYDEIINLMMGNQDRSTSYAKSNTSTHHRSKKQSSAVRTQKVQEENEKT